MGDSAPSPRLSNGPFSSCPPVYRSMANVERIQNKSARKEEDKEQRKKLMELIDVSSKYMGSWGMPYAISVGRAHVFVFCIYARLHKSGRAMLGTYRPDLYAPLSPPPETK